MFPLVAYGAEERISADERHLDAHKGNLSTYYVISFTS
jgi:hypothetical protein